MYEWDNKTTDVLIVGAGPTGLMMACQLAMHKVSFRIIDKNESLSKSSGALILQARSLEIVEKMGIAQDAVKQGIVADAINIVFDGETIKSTAIKNIGKNLSQFPFLLMLEQSKTEKLLLKFIGESHNFVERGIHFQSFIQEKDTISSVVILPDGTTQTITSKYLIAADGAASSVRNFLHIPFEGISYPKPIFILDCTAKTNFIPGEINFVFSNSTVAGFFSLPDSRWRIDSPLPKSLEKFGNITFDQIETAFHLSTQLDIKFKDVEWFSITHVHQKYAKVMRVQNCFLAGDAAHVNTPIGSQGMNTGLQDAFNLAWKLAYVIKNKAKPSLLDTYSLERLGISKGFARYADTLFKLLTNNNSAAKFIRPYGIKVLLKIIFPLLNKLNVVRQRFFISISQIGIHYRSSILSTRQSEGNFPHKAPKPGDRLPYVEFLYKGIKTNDFKILGAISFNLFILSDTLPVDIEKIAEKFNLTTKVIKRSPENKKFYKLLGIKHSGYYLIRPDMHIALRSASLDSIRLNDYLHQFLI